MTIGDRIKKARELRGMSQEELADKCGRTISIRYFESKDTLPTINGLVKLCDVLNVTADYLLGRTDDIETNAKPPDFKS